MARQIADSARGVEPPAGSSEMMSPGSIGIVMSCLDWLRAALADFLRASGSGGGLGVFCRTAGRLRRSGRWLIRPNAARARVAHELTPVLSRASTPAA